MRLTLVLTLALAAILPAAASQDPQNQARAWGSRNEGPAGSDPKSDSEPAVKRFHTNAERFRAGLPPLPPKVKSKKNQVVSLNRVVVVREECMLTIFSKRSRARRRCNAQFCGLGWMLHYESPIFIAYFLNRFVFGR